MTNITPSKLAVNTTPELMGVGRVPDRVSSALGGRPGRPGLSPSAQGFLLSLGTARTRAVPPSLNPVQGVRGTGSTEGFQGPMYDYLEHIANSPINPAQANDERWDNLEDLSVLAELNQVIEDIPGTSQNTPSKKRLRGDPFAGDCPTWYIHGECECGEKFVRQVLCGRDWCPTCGAEWSDAHKRRYARVWQKASVMASVGYFVFTLPLSIRSKYRSKGSLRSLRARTVAILKRHGFDRGLSRFHFFGDKHPDLYHPHLNVLVDAGYLAPDVLESIKREYAKTLGVSMADVNYQYCDETAEVSHKVKYITRATFTDISTRENQALAIELNNFRNSQAWGGKSRWETPVIHVLTSDEVSSGVLMLVQSQCPACGQRVVWSVPLVHKSWLLCHPVEDIGAGFYHVLNTV
jgi:hypothetical protein